MATIRDRLGHIVDGQNSYISVVSQFELNVEILSDLLRRLCGSVPAGGRQVGRCNTAPRESQSHLNDTNSHSRDDFPADKPTFQI